MAAAVRRQLEAVGQGTGEGAVGAGGRNALDAVPLLQLGWELDQLVGLGAGDVSNNMAIVVATAGATTGCNNAGGLAAEAGGDPRQAALLAAASGRLPHLQAALHELWLRWHAAVWEGPDARHVTGTSPMAAGALGPWAEAMSAPPVRLYLVSW